MNELKEILCSHPLWIINKNLSYSFSMHEAICDEIKAAIPGAKCYRAIRTLKVEGEILAKGEVKYILYAFDGKAFLNFDEPRYYEFIKQSESGDLIFKTTAGKEVTFSKG